MSQVTSLPAVTIPPPVQPALSPRAPVPMLKQEPRSDHKSDFGKPSDASEPPKVHLTLAELVSTPPAALATPSQQSHQNEAAPGTMSPGDKNVQAAATGTEAISVRKEERRTDEWTVDSGLKTELKRSSSESSTESDAVIGNARKTRRGGKMFQCVGFGNCNMCFSRSEHLARHIRKHTGERPFQCKCGRAFSRLDNLRQHIYTVHATEPQNYQTIKQCLPVNIQKKRDAKTSVAMVPPQLVTTPGFMPGVGPLTPLTPGLATRMPPMMMPMSPPGGVSPSQGAPAPSPVAGTAHSPPTIMQASPPSVAQIPQSQSHSQQLTGLSPPMTMRLPSKTDLAPTAQIPGMGPVVNPPQTAHSPVGIHCVPAQSGGAMQMPALVYVGEAPQIFCMPPQQQAQVVPQYVPQYGYPIQLAYPPAPQFALNKTSSHPPSPSMSQAASQAASPRVSTAPSPQ